MQEYLIRINDEHLVRFATNMLQGRLWHQAYEAAIRHLHERGINPQIRSLELKEI